MSNFTPDALVESVRSLFEKNNYTCEGPLKIHGAEVDLLAQSKSDPFAAKIYVEVTIEYVGNDKYGKDATKFILIREKDPSATCLIVSSEGFSLPVSERASQSRVQTLTYNDLFRKFERFSSYVDAVLSEGAIAADLRSLNEIYEEPSFVDRVGAHKAIQYLDQWRLDQNSEKRWLIVVGEYGTGKTALTKVLQFRWTEDYFQHNERPIPFRIELREMTRQFDARGLLHNFLDRNGLSHVSLDFVFSLLAQGRVILLLDGYDEMAQYLHTRERRVCLEALAALSAGGARRILTSRPNYFSEAEEFQVFELLYSSLKGRVAVLTRSQQEILDAERRIDDLLKAQFLERFERSLQDLTPEQTEALVRRCLKDDPEGQDLVLRVLRRVFRETNEGAQVALSGKPVIITYLLEIVEQLKAKRVAGDSLTLPSALERLSEWQLYSLVVDELMIRDYRRTPEILPDVRRKFLQELSLFLSSKDNSFITEHAFRDVIRRFFREEIRRKPQEDRDKVVESYFSDLRSSATLTRRGGAGAIGRQFSHNSLREFLLSEYLLNEIQNDRQPISVTASDAMRQFVASRSQEEIGRVGERLREEWDNRESNPLVSTVLNLVWPALHKYVKQDQDKTRRTFDLLTGSRGKASSIRINRLDLSTERNSSDLREYDFSTGEFTSVNFQFADLRKTIFVSSLFENCSFEGSDLRDADFRYCFLIDAILVAAQLQSTNFIGLDTSSTIMIEASETVPSLRALSGNEMLGYLSFRGGTG